VTPWAYPMRLAGTAKQYSSSAIPPPTRIAVAIIQVGNRSWPYHATVMKLLDIRRRTKGSVTASYAGLRRTASPPVTASKGCCAGEPYVCFPPKADIRRTIINADFAVLQPPDCGTHSQHDSVANALSQMPATKLNLTYVTVNIRNIRDPG
jgi:hypothetical protein